MASKKSTRYELLDLWRGAACLLVVFAHSNEKGALAYFGLSAVVAGKVGVGVFFAISGYCITAAVRSCRERGAGFWSFMQRRFTRIYPPYWFALILILSSRVGANWFVPGAASEFDYTLWQVAGNLTLTESWRFQFVGGPRHLALAQAWTLCIEEQFYLVCALLVLARSANQFLWILALTALTALALVVSNWISLPIEGTMFAGHWLSFAAGVFLFFALHGGGKEKATSIAILVVAFVFAPWYPEEYFRTAIAVMFSLISIFLYSYDSKLSSAAGLHWLKMCGLISYSLYLTHPLVCSPISRLVPRIGAGEFVAASLALLLCVSVSLLVAWPFFVLFERPFIPSMQGARKSSSGELPGEPSPAITS